MVTVARETEAEDLLVVFDRRLRLEFQGTKDAGLLAFFTLNTCCLRGRCRAGA
jgi:hypothetical protein